ncbi:MAG: methyltransferase domain-containing protein [Actinomycetota bacterium]|nr:methyltransferase domain-containing protein [Actinomycetota bacterium]
MTAARPSAPAIVASRSKADRDWDAATYDRVSDPQVSWANEVLERLLLQGDETVLDAGCGSGRVTRLLLDRLPHGRVIAVDAAPSMVERAREALPERAEILRADLAELKLSEPVDAVFSNAVFHWVGDHDQLFERLQTALRPGGHLVGQCGGEGNVERFHAAVRAVGDEAPFSEHLGGWAGPWNFQSADATTARLERAGFKEVRCWLEPRPTTPAEPRAYLTTVCLGYHLEQLPAHLRDRYVDAVVERIGDPLELDYVRLNIDARRPR